MSCRENEGGSQCDDELLSWASGRLCFVFVRVARNARMRRTGCGAFPAYRHAIPQNRHLAFTPLDNPVSPRHIFAHVRVGFTIPPFERGRRPDPLGDAPLV